MPTTTNHALRYPVLGDAANVPLDIQRLAEDADLVLAGHEARLDARDTVAKPMCRIEATADISLSNNIVTTVDFATASTTYDTNGMADLAADGIRIQTAGYYRFVGHLPFAANATGLRVTLLRINGITRVQDYRPPVSGSVTAATLNSEAILCAANDLVTLVALQNSGAAMTVSAANGIRPYLAAEFVAHANGTLWR